MEVVAVEVGRGLEVIGKSGKARDLIEQEICDLAANILVKLDRWPWPQVLPAVL